MSFPRPASPYSRRDRGARLLSEEPTSLVARELDQLTTKNTIENRSLSTQSGSLEDYNLMWSGVYTDNDRLMSSDDDSGSEDELPHKTNTQERTALDETLDDYAEDGRDITTVLDLDYSPGSPPSGALPTLAVQGSQKAKRQRVDARATKTTKRKVRFDESRNTEHPPFPHFDPSPPSSPPRPPSLFSALGFGVMSGPEYYQGLDDNDPSSIFCASQEAQDVASSLDRLFGDSDPSSSFLSPPFHLSNGSPAWSSPSSSPQRLSPFSFRDAPPSPVRPAFLSAQYSPPSASSLSSSWTPSLDLDPTDSDTDTDVDVDGESDDDDQDDDTNSTGNESSSQRSQETTITRGILSPSRSPVYSRRTALQASVGAAPFSPRRPRIASPLPMRQRPSSPSVGANGMARPRLPQLKRENSSMSLVLVENSRHESMNSVPPSLPRQRLQRESSTLCILGTSEPDSPPPSSPSSSSSTHLITPPPELPVGSE